MVFLRSRILDFFYFAPEFAICGALCAEYQTKSPFFSKTVTATHLQVLPFDSAHQLLPSRVFLGYWITSGQKNQIFMLTPKFLFCGPQCAESVELSVVAVGGVNGEIAMSRTGNDSWMLFSNCWCTSVFVFSCGHATL